MKKKIFTLMCLSFLLSSVISSVYAQSITWGTIPYEQGTTVENFLDLPRDGYWFTFPEPDTANIDKTSVSSTDNNHGALFSQCEYTFKIEAGNDATTTYFAIVAFPDKDGSKLNGDTLYGYLNIANPVKVAKKDTLYVPFSVNDLPARYDSVQIIAYKDKIGGTLVTVHNGKYFFNYVPPTPDEKGVAVLSITGGSKNLLRSLNGGITWKPVYKDGAIIPFTDEEIDHLFEYIYLKDPNTCSYITIQVKNDGTPPAPPTLPRLVTLPSSISGAVITAPIEKIQYVQSGSDFKFTLTVTDPKMVPVVSTGRSLAPVDDYKIEPLGDGKFEITIKKVQTALNISITVAQSNEAVEGNQVIAAGGQILLKAAKAAQAKVYGTTGALIRQLTLAAGETTAVTLPNGFYIVAIGNKAYKVVLK